MLKKYLQLIFEDSNIQQINKVVAFPGRVSPPTKAHIQVYNKLCDEFGQSNVYILTANPKELDEKNPFTFEEKKQMLIACGIPNSNIKKMEGSAYRWETIAQAVGIKNPEHTILISAMGAKDANDRLKGNYYKPYNNGILMPMNEQGYIKILDNMNVEGTDVPVSATVIREAIKNKDIQSIKSLVLPGVFNWLKRKFGE